MSLTNFRRSLPIFSKKSDIQNHYKNHKTLIIAGDTGSGKTTQVPQYIYDIECKSSIVITQPRRVAAINVSKRVAEEMGYCLGDLVGYSIRFEEMSSPQTRIKFVTDGMLLREALLDPLLLAYSLVILDEIHERSLNTDILCALLKRIQKKRKNFKIICMSASINVEILTSYFQNSAVINIPGRLHRVDVWYTTTKEDDYLDTALNTILQIHTEHPLTTNSDILVFLTGQEDIETLQNLIEERKPLFPVNTSKLEVLPLYAALPNELQMRVFEKSNDKNCRRVILATNIAESSITINGIRYVIDSGLAKKRFYRPNTGMDYLQVCPISRQEAWQRTGRAGREQAGICYRMFPTSTFDSLNETMIPEILRCNLSLTLLQLKAIKIDISKVDFIDLPPIESLKKAKDILISLECLDEDENITTIGSKIVSFPLIPLYGKILYMSQKYNCVEEVLSIVSMLSVENIFFSPKNKIVEANIAKTRFISKKGDHLTLLNVYRSFIDSKCLKSWCFSNFLNYRSLMKAKDIRKQLQDHLTNIKNSKSKEKSKKSKEKVHSNSDIYNDNLSITDRIIMCLANGLFFQSAKLQADGTYRTVNGQQVYIHPSSVLFHSDLKNSNSYQKNPSMNKNKRFKRFDRFDSSHLREKEKDYLIFSELIFTSKLYIRDVSIIDYRYLEEIMPNFFTNIKFI